MPQRAIININGDLIPFSENLDRIRTPGLGGSAVTWVPDADTICDQLKVTANGTYSAAEAGKYGYDYVVVSVPGSSVTGRDPDTGEDVEVHRDPDTGEIVETVIPVEIRVIEPPTNPYGTYRDGQTITKDGMVVKAYLASGGEYGTVPNSEITLNPTTAVYDASKDQPAGGEKSSDLSTGFVQPIPYQASFEGKDAQGNSTKVAGGSAMIAFGGTIPKYIIASASSPIQYTVTRTSASDPTHPSIKPGTLSGSAVSHDGKTAYYIELSTGYNVDGKAERNSEPLDMGNAAWTVIYGEGEERPAGSTQTITVSWPRPGDGAILETTFDINVGPHGGGPTGED